MQRNLQKIIGTLMLLACFAMLFAATESVHAFTLADGTYTIDYTIKKPDDESVSMANDYWDKPATLIVGGGAITVQMTVNHSEWVTKFKVPSGSSYIDTKVISRDESANTRLTQFTIDSVDKPMLAQIHVTVPEIDYDHDYTIRFVFDTNSLKLISEPEATVTPEPTAKATVIPKPDDKAEASDIEAGSSTVKLSNPTKESTAIEKNDGAKSGAATSAPAATAVATDSKGDAAEKDDAQSSNQTVDNDTNAVTAVSTTAPDQADKADQDDAASDSEQSSDESAVEVSAEEHAETGKEEVELTTALDGAVAVSVEGVLSASVAPESSKKSGIIIISFLAALLVASIITIAIYRKRKSSAV